MKLPFFIENLDLWQRLCSRVKQETDVADFEQVLCMAETLICSFKWQRQIKVSLRLCLFFMQRQMAAFNLYCRRVQA